MDGTKTFLMICFEKYLRKLAEITASFRSWVDNSTHRDKFWALVKTCAAPKNSIRVHNWPEWLRERSMYHRLAFFTLNALHVYTQNPDSEEIQYTGLKDSPHILDDFLENEMWRFIFGFPQGSEGKKQLEELITWERSLHLEFSPVHSSLFFQRFHSNQKSTRDPRIQLQIILKQVRGGRRHQRPLECKFNVFTKKLCFRC